MKRHSFRDKIRYRFDNFMSRGSLGLLWILVIFIVVAVIAISGLITLLGFNDGDSIFNLMWDSFANIINAWVPSFDDGTLGYRVMMAIAALTGVVVTGSLIGVVASAIEEKFIGLRKGNSQVVEEDHLVILGYYDGEHTLLRQLILAARNKPRTIVIGSEKEKDDLAEYIRDNVKVPSNIKIICRQVDPLDPVSLEKLSIATCRSVVISPTDDTRTVKILLALIDVMKKYQITGIDVNAIIAKEDNRFPSLLAKQHGITVLQSANTLGRMIAHSCTQPGLSEVFRDLFNFEGSELYLIKLPGQENLTFEQLTLRVEGAAPVGIMHDDELRINPRRDQVITSDDEILVYGPTAASARLLAQPACSPVPFIRKYHGQDEPTNVTIFGNKSSLKTILRELPDDINQVTLVNYDHYNQELIQSICDQRHMKLILREGDVRVESVLYNLVRDARHVIIQSNYGDEEEADNTTIFLLLHLRDIRKKHQLTFNITAEMRREKNQVLASDDDNTDFIVASNISAMMLAQLAETPQLLGAFREILSNIGNELYLRPADTLECLGEHLVGELRQILLEQGYIFLGFMKADGSYVLNPSIRERVTLDEGCSLIVFGEY
ncbi:MAG: hypothetical protein IJS38_02465 [Erysipelotrichaceae bacterium]|nr:hypothetical protein [Erysipelotrichaceae bacterium]